VPGHLDLGHDRDVAPLGVAHELAQLALGVEAVVRFRFGVAVGEARSLRGQERIRIDRHAPALVVGQVQVQHVQLVERHPIDGLLQILDRLERAAAVEHHPAPREARLVADRHAGHDDHVLDLRNGWEELEQRLGAAKDARIRGADHADPLLAYV